MIIDPHSFIEKSMCTMLHVIFFIFPTLLLFFFIKFHFISPYTAFPRKFYSCIRIQEHIN
jgi:hypothetical protein